MPLMDPTNMFGQNDTPEVKNGKNKKQVKVKLKFNLWMVVGIMLFVFFAVPIFVTAWQLSGNSSKLEISQLVNDIKEEKVDKVQIDTTKLIVHYKDGSVKFSTKEDSQNFTSLLKDSGVDPTKVNYTIIDQSIARTIADIGGILLPIILMAAFFLYL